MKCVLTVGRTKWICPNATVPAKVVELLGSLQSAGEFYPDDGIGGAVLGEVSAGDKWHHEITIESLDESRVLIGKKLLEWRREHAAPKESA